MDSGEEEAKRARATSKELPHKVVADILSRLPAKSVLRSRCVCKKWNELTREPSFIDAHRKLAGRRPPQFMVTHWDAGKLGLQHVDFVSAEILQTVSAEALSPENFSAPRFPPHIVTSCNGLLLLTSNGFTSERVYVCNPATGEFMTLPEPNRRKTILSMYAFAYSSSTKQYKVLRVYHPGSQRCEVHTVGTNSWRDLGELPAYAVNEGEPAVVAGGAVYFDARSYDDERLCVIVSIDIESEKIRLIPRPSFEGPSGLVALGDQVCAVDYSEDVEIVMWAPCDPDGEDWDPEYVIDITREGTIEIIDSPVWCIFPLMIVNGEIVIIDRRTGFLHSYNRSSQTCRRIRSPGLRRWYDITPHFSTLVSLKEFMRNQEAAGTLESMSEERFETGSSGTGRRGGMYQLRDEIASLMWEDYINGQGPLESSAN